MNQVVTITDKTFRQEVLESKIPILVDFWASWCPPCKSVEPILSELVAERDGEIRIGRINVDQNPKTSAEFDIEGVPTFMLFKKGKVLKREVGARSKQQLFILIKEAGVEVSG